MEVLIITAILLLATGGAEAGALATSPEVRAAHGGAWAGFRSGWGKEWAKSEPVRSAWSKRTRARLRGPDRIRGVKPVQRAKRRAGRALLGAVDAAPAAVRAARFWSPLVRSSVGGAVQGYRDARGRTTGTDRSGPDTGPDTGPDQAALESGPVRDDQTGPDQAQKAAQLPTGSTITDGAGLTAVKIADSPYPGFPWRTSRGSYYADELIDHLITKGAEVPEADVMRPDRAGPDQATPHADHERSVSVTHPSGIPPEQRCEWCDDAPQETTRGKLKVCSACGSEIDQGTRSAQERFQTPPVTPSPADDRGDPVPDGDYIDSVTGERMTLVEKYRRQGFVINADGYIVGHPPEIPDDEKATSHLAQDESGRSTRCGAPWEPWQGPDYRGFRGWMYPRPWRPTKHCSACTDLYRAEERKRKAELESEPEPPRAPDGRCIERVPGMTTIEVLTRWGATREDDLWEKRPVPGSIRCPNRATGPDGLCDEHRTDPPAGTSPAGGTTTSTEGTRMGLREIINQGRDGDGTASSGTRGGVATMTRPARGEAEVDDLATLKRIAAQVVQQHEDSEFMKIIRMCQTLPEGTDFGNRVGKVLAEFAQACVALGKVGDEVAEMAPSVSAIAEHVRGED